MTTVGELVAALQRYPQDMTVVVDGYEGGLSDPQLREAWAVLGRGGPYEGDHAEAGDGSVDSEGRWEFWTLEAGDGAPPPVRVLCVSRGLYGS